MSDTHEAFEAVWTSTQLGQVRLASPKTITGSRRNRAAIFANYLPDNFDPSTVDEATAHAIDVLNEELIAAGARLLAVGLAPASQAKSLRTQPNGELLIIAGPVSGEVREIPYSSLPTGTPYPSRQHGRKP